MSAEDIRDEFIGKLAEIVHEESKKQRNNKETETTLDE